MFTDHYKPLNVDLPYGLELFAHLLEWDDRMSNEAKIIWNKREYNRLKGIDSFCWKDSNYRKEYQRLAEALIHSRMYEKL